MDKNWKRFERRVAEVVGGYRAWGQAVAGSKAGGHIPVVCVGEQNSSNIFAIVELKTLVTLLEYALKEEEIHVVEL